jgi:hypothetical protein
MKTARTYPCDNARITLQLLDHELKLAAEFLCSAGITD